MSRPCMAIKKNGERCKNGAKEDHIFCGPHADNPPADYVKECTVLDCTNEQFEDEVLCKEHLDEAYSLMEQDMLDNNPGMEVMMEEANIANITYITITGHRPNKLGGYNPKAELNVKVYEALERKMVNAVSKFGNVVFRIGMAIGVDQMAAHICVKHGFTFDAYVPCEGQEKPWPKHVQDEYRKLLTYARNVYKTHDGPYPGAWVLHRRNEQMVDGVDGVQADYLLSVYDGTAGGTASCVKYAREKGVREVNINPREL